MRGDDGVGWWIAGRVEQYYASPSVEVEFVRQFTPELAEPVSQADLVIFVDCSAIAAPGDVSVLRVEPAASLPRVLTHHMEPASVLGMAMQLYGKVPDFAYVLTVGGKSFELAEELTEPVLAAVPTAVELVGRLLRSDKEAGRSERAAQEKARVRVPMSWPAARR
jgi:hydrogenase maturation protease